MSVVERLIDYSNFFPETNLKSSELKLLRNINPRADIGKYLTLAIILSVIFSLLTFLTLRIQMEKFWVLLVLFALFLLAFIKLPDLQLATKTAKMESELPVFLRTMALLLEMNINFSRALQIASEENGELNRELKNITKEIEKGASLQKTFSSLSNRTTSIQIKRGINQLLSVYNSGSGAQELKKLADEFLSIQRFKLREYASKAALLGLLFIAFSTILPTFFIVTTMLSKSFFESNISKTEITIAFLVVFPALSALTIVIAKSMLPQMLLSKNEKFNYLPIIAVIALVISTLILQHPVSDLISFFIFLILILTFVLEHKKQTRIQDIDDCLPDALMSVSSLPKGTRTDRIFENWRDGDYATLSDESAVCVRQLKANVKPENVLLSLSKRNDSYILKRVCNFIKIAIDTNTTDKLTNVADDILKFKEINRERQNTLAMQRYTIIFASFLMPLITKSSIFLVSSMQRLGENVTPTTFYFSTFYEIMPIYILIYALLASYFISELEARKHMATVYFMITATIAMVTFYFINI